MGSAASPRHVVRHREDGSPRAVRLAPTDPQRCSSCSCAPVTWAKKSVRRAATYALLPVVVRPHATRGGGGTRYMCDEHIAPYLAPAPDAALVETLLDARPPQTLPTDTPAPERFGAQQLLAAFEMRCYRVRDLRFPEDSALAFQYRTVARGLATGIEGEDTGPVQLWTVLRALQRGASALDAAAITERDERVAAFLAAEGVALARPRPTVAHDAPRTRNRTPRRARRTL